MSIPVGGPHPDDELLSAYLDGEAAAIDGHESCPDCARRLEQLGRAAAWVATPPASVPDLDAAVLRALDGQPGDRSGATVLADRARLDFGRRRVLAGLAVAAVVVVAFGSVSILRSRDTQSSDVASDLSADRAIANGGDLGEQADPLALATTVRVALTGSAGPMAATAADSSGGGSEGGSGQPSSPMGPPDAAQRETQANAPAFTATTSSKPATRECVAASTPASGGGQLVYSATLRWKGEVAVALGYHLTSGSLPYRLVVMRRPDCRLLVVQSF